MKSSACQKNIIIKDIDRPLIIKVASISAARMQVYFIDNEDYFQKIHIQRRKRKVLPTTMNGAYFCSGSVGNREETALEAYYRTLSRMAQPPVALYLKKAYRNDPLFTHAKVVLSLYNDLTTETFNENMRSKVLTGGMKTKDVEFLAEPGAVNLAKTAIQYADGVRLANPDVDPSLTGYAKSLELPVLPFIDPQDPESTYITDYNRFYEKILETK